jgi:hypothetical protein
MQLGRFVLDTHVHSQRHAAGRALKGSKDYGNLGKAMVQIEPYDNFPRLLYDMSCYGVDMCIVEPAFGMTNETNLEQKKKHPDKIVCNCWPQEYRKRALNDPGIGAEKLIWGTDWGASLPVYSQPNRYPPGYTRQNLKEGIVREKATVLITRVLKFLQEFQRAKTPPILNLDEQTWKYHFDKLPYYSLIQVPNSSSSIRY